MTPSAEFPATTTSVAAARRFVARTIADVDGAALETITLMVSELATNCVRHARTPYTISVRRAGSEVRVDVTDRGAGHARVRHPSPRESHGRGLRIVGALADDWGVIDEPRRPGKTAWFSFTAG